MSRKERYIMDQDFCFKVLDEAEFLTLAFSQPEAGAVPHIIPVNFVRVDDALYLHCAAEGGRKLELTRQAGRVAFHAVTDVKIIAEKSTTYYRSVCGEGRISEVTDRNEKSAALNALATRFKAACPNPLPEQALERTGVLRIDQLRLCGKKNPLES